MTGVGGMIDTIRAAVADSLELQKTLSRDNEAPGSRVQEAPIPVGHLLCRRSEDALAPEASG